MNTPLVSVVVPVFNGEQFISETIDSIYQQDYPAIEIIMIDDGSTDNSASIISRFSKIKYYYQTNKGPAAAKNLGSQVAKGDYIAYLDCDDIWLKSKLSQQVAFMENQPSLDYSITHMHLFLSDAMKKPHWLKTELLDQPHPAYLPSSLMIRRRALDTIGLFDESFKSSDDVDWFFRAKDLNIPMAILPDVLLLRRIHDHNLSHQIELLNKVLLKTVRRSIERNQTIFLTNQRIE